MKKRKLRVILMICAVCTLLTGAAFADTSGRCGDHVSWSLDNYGTLTVSGLGDMYDYVAVSGNGSRVNTAPWGELRASVSRVIISSGVTNVGRCAFYGFDRITSVQIGADVLTIAPSAFENCENLRTVTLGGCVKSIEEWAFGNCTGMTGINLNEGLKSIGNYAFINCRSLPTVTLPTTLDDIGIYAFSGCSGLTSISLPATVSSIKEGTFSGCSGLIIATIPDTVVSIGDKAFYNCTSMSIVSIPSGLSSLGSYAFYHCSSLANAAIPAGVSEIKDWTFGHCSSLKTLVIPIKVNKIGQCAFYGCVGITDAHYNGTLAQWDAVNKGDGNGDINAGVFHTKDHDVILAYDKCGENLYYLLDGSGVLTISGTGDMEEYESEKIGDLLVTTAPWGEFRSSVKKLVVEQGVTSISRCAFYGCDAMTSVSLPDSVVSIGDHAFRGCSKLASVKLGKGLTDIGYSAFYACSELNGISIPNGVKNIGEGAFCYCSSLTDIVIPDGVQNIGQWMFYYCSKLKNVTIGAGVQSIGNSAFAYCSSLISIVIPDNVTELKEWAFGYCTALRTVSVGARLKTIAAYAFCGCSGITDVYYSGAKYQWEAINVGSYNEALLYAVLHANKLDAPAATSGINPANGKPQIKWAAVKGADKYEIWRATSSSGTYTKMYTTSSKSYTNSTAKVGTTYYYRVKAISSSGSMSESVFSSVVSATCVCAPPAVTAGNNSSTGKVTLKWEAVDGAAKYEIWRASSESGTYTKMSTTSSTSYTNTSANPGYTYYYMVKAIAAAGSKIDSSFSEVVSRTCDCAKPTVTITLSSGHPKLSWAAVDGATKYEVYRATSKDGKYTLLGTTSNRVYTNTSAGAGTTYYYKIIAVSSRTTAANSAYSNVVSIKAK